MRSHVNYSHDWCSEDGMDQLGMILVSPDSGGKITGQWECRGGKGRGTKLLENTTDWSDDFAETVLNSSGLSQGIGEFVVDIDDEDPESITMLEWIG